MPKGKRDKGKAKAESTCDDVSKNDQGNKITVTGKPTQGPKTEADFRTFGCTPEIAKTLANALKAPITTLNLRRNNIGAIKAIELLLERNIHKTMQDAQKMLLPDIAVHHELLNAPTTLQQTALPKNTASEEGPPALTCESQQKDTNSLQETINKLESIKQKFLAWLLLHPCSG